ncbi:FAD-dependent monooxygenase [Thermobifida halotolerans]|uniref:FAD-dependent monooxygenase n=1 Tax=Thermobifida halotolerans TaxID=483545 RepID=A0A399G6U7_9ACTN|nr:FAD-dependent monooxygenase [Thermobifida halotolerans]UOE20840.1 FAD-dependent monooxygenase [Thermobifida halotolerans]
MTSTDRTILVSGASIAGPALAYWLRRLGFTPTVVERAPRLRDGGYAIDVRGAAVEVADRMGLLPQIRRARTGMRALSVVGADGHRRATLDVARLGDDTAARDAELMRGHLSRILYAATEHDVEYVFDDSVTALEETPDGVHVTFENAAPRTFGLVVGADGLHSTVRRIAFGPEERFRRDLGNYISIFGVPNHLGLDREAMLHNTPGRLAGLYSAAPHTGRVEPPGPGEETAAGPNPRAQAILAFSSRREIPFDHRDTAAHKQILRTVFADVGWEAPRLLRHLADTTDFYFDSISQIRMDHWSRGRTVLVGDAAHCPSPLSGQGTSLALVGAYVLACELAAADGDHRAAFTRYEQRMRGYVAQNQALVSSGGGILVPATRARIWLRDQMMRLAALLPVVARLGGGIQRAANAVELPDHRVLEGHAS